MAAEIDHGFFLPDSERQVYRAFDQELLVALESWNRGVNPGRIAKPDPRPFAELAQRSAKQCRKLLAILSPDVAVAAWRQADPVVLQGLNDLTLLNRLLWALAAGATGHSDDPCVINRFLVHAARWWTAQWTADSFEKFEEMIDLELGDSASREFLTRTSSSVIRYHWASRMICTEIGNQIQQDPDYSAVLPEFTVANIGRCLDLAWQDGQLTTAITPWTDPATDFVRHIALKAGALA